MTPTPIALLSVLLLACGAKSMGVDVPSEAGPAHTTSDTPKAYVPLARPVIPSVPAMELKRYQSCSVDADCILTHVGCCRGRSTVAIAARMLGEFRARDDCTRVQRCPLADPLEPERARCIEGRCERVGGEQSYGIEY